MQPVCEPPLGGRLPRRQRRNGNRSAGNWSAGVGATIDHKYFVPLPYIASYGRYDTDSTGAATNFAGPFAGLSDRG